MTKLCEYSVNIAAIWKTQMQYKSLLTLTLFSVQNFYNEMNAVHQDNHLQVFEWESESLTKRYNTISKTGAKTKRVALVIGV